MRGFVWMCAAAAAAVADATLAPVAWPAGARPDFGLVVIALAALPTAQRPSRWGLAWGCGLVKDLFAIGPFGVYALTGLVVAVAAERIGRRLDMASPVWRLLTAVAAAGAARMALGSAFGAPGDAVPAGLTSMVLAAAAVIAGSRRAWRGAT